MAAAVEKGWWLPANFGKQLSSRNE